MTGPRGRDTMMVAGRIFHITTRQEAAAATRSGEYTPAGFDTEGFIHCSYAHQVQAVADLAFRGRSDLVLLEIDRDLVPCEVVDENLEGGGEPFPHVYGHLPMSAIVRIHGLPGRQDGSFQLPADVRQ